MRPGIALIWLSSGNTMHVHLSSVASALRPRTYEFRKVLDSKNMDLTSGFGWLLALNMASHLHLWTYM